MFQFERTRHGIAGFAASDSERRHAGAVEFGKVTEADYVKRRLKVLIGDEDDEDGHIITGWLPMPGLRAQNDFDWHPLEVGERVAVLSASGELQNGLVLPAGIFCDDNPAPGDKAGLWIRKFQDGGKITYDRDTGEWLIEGMAKATVKVADSTVTVEQDKIEASVGGASTITVEPETITIDAPTVNIAGGPSTINLTAGAGAVAVHESGMEVTGGANVSGAMAAVEEVASGEGFRLPDGLLPSRTEFDGAVSSLNSAVTALGGEVSAVQSDVSTVQSDVSDLSDTTTDLQTQVNQKASTADLNEAVGNLQDEIDSLPPPPTSGTYAPTVSAPTNTDSTPVVTSAMWIRVGNTVSVTGTVSVDATAVGAVTFKLSLPAASGVAAADLCGTIGGGSATGSGGKALMSLSAAGTDATTYGFAFMYQVK